jgi:hypothetical protein
LIVNAAERDDGSAHAFRAEAWEGLRESSFGERGHGQHFRRGDDALSTSAVEANLEHESASPYFFTAEPTIEARSAKRLE